MNYPTRPLILQFLTFLTERQELEDGRLAALILQFLALSVDSRRRASFLILPRTDARREGRTDAGTA
jgi:hypothetical protein